MAWAHVPFDQENQDPTWSPSGKLPGLYESGTQGAPATQAPFRFHAHRTRIDWRILHGVDVDEVVRRTDIDTLERCVNAVAFGDIEAEGPGSLTRVNFMRIFRLSQLTAEYLLHVQDRLAAETSRLRSERNRACKHVEALRLGIKESKEKLGVSQKEVKQLKKTLKMVQRLVPQQVSHPPAEGAEAGEKLPPGVASRLQAQVDQLQEERCTLREDLTQLRLALQHSQQQGVRDKEAAVIAARIQERDAASGQLAAALEQERARHRKSSPLRNEMASLRQTLAASNARIQELEEGAFTDEYDLPIQGHGRLTSEAAQVNARASALEGRLKAQAMELKELKRQRARPAPQQSTAPLASHPVDHSRGIAGELKSTVAQLTRQSEEMQLLRTELARAKQEGPAASRSLPPPSSAPAAATMTQGVTRLGPDTSVHRSTASNINQATAESVEPKERNSDTISYKAQQRAELAATLQQGRRLHDAQALTPDASPVPQHAATYPLHSASPPVTPAPLVHAHTMPALSGLAPSPQGLLQAPGAESPFPLPGQPRDMSPRKRRSWLAKLNILKRSRRQGSRQGSPDKSQAGLSSTVASPASGAAEYAPTSLFENTYGVHFSPLRDGIDPGPLRFAASTPPNTRSLFRPNTAPDGISTAATYPQPSRFSPSMPAPAKSLFASRTAPQWWRNAPNLAATSPTVQSPASRSVGDLPRTFTSQPLSPHRLASSTLPVSTVAEQPLSPTNPAILTRKLDQTGGRLGSLSRGRSLATAPARPARAVGLAATARSHSLSPEDRPTSASLLGGFASTLRVPTSPSGSPPQSPKYVATRPASPEGPKAAVGTPRTPHQPTRSGTISAVGLSFRNSPRAKESNVISAPGMQPVRTKPRAYNLGRLA